MPVYHRPKDQEILKRAEDFPLENMSKEYFIELLKRVLYFLRHDRPPIFRAYYITGPDGNDVDYNDFVQNIIVFLLFNDFFRVYYNEKNRTYILFPHSKTDQDEELREAINSDLHYEDPDWGYARKKFRDIFKRVDQEGNKVSVVL